MTDSPLLIETANGIRTIRVNRPDKLNALNAATLDALDAAFAAAITALNTTPEKLLADTATLNAVLPCARFGDNSGFAHSFCKQALAEHIIDFVGAGVI